MISDNQVVHVQPIRVDQHEHDCSSFYLYNWALLILGDDSTMGPATASQISAIVLYNTGLCYQMMGMAAIAEQSFHQKALKMYNMALSLVDPGQTSGRLLQLASLNNKGTIMAWFYEHRAAQECLGYLQHLLANNVEIHEAQREDMLEIRMNVALLLARHNHAAAA